MTVQSTFGWTRIAAAAVAMLGLLAVAAFMFATPRALGQSNSPAAVASVSVSRGDGTLTASWNAPANATRYHVTYTTNNGQSWTLGASGHTQTTWTLNSADNSATYVVGVRAGNDADDWST